MFIIKFFVSTAALLGFLAVSAGALGAHLIKAELSPVDAASYDTAVSYLFVHAFAIMIVALLIRSVANRWLLIIAGFSFLIGILLFSGSILLRLSLPISLPFPLAPGGGILLMLGWVSLAISGLMITSND